MEFLYLHYTDLNAGKVQRGGIPACFHAFPTSISAGMSVQVVT